MNADDILKKYAEPIKPGDLSKYYEFKALIEEAEELSKVENPDKATEDKKSKVASQMMTKVGSVVDVFKRLLFRASRDEDAPNEMIVMMIEELSMLAQAKGGASFADFEMAKLLLEEGDDN